MWSSRAARAALAALALGVGACSTLPRNRPAAVVEKKNRAAEYTQFGDKAYHEANYDSALTFFEQALALSLSVDDEAGVVQSLGSLGKIRIALGELEEAEQLLLKAERLAATQPAPLRLRTRVALAELALRRGDADGARTLLQSAPLDDPTLAGTTELALYHHTLAVADRRLQALDSAVTHLQAALAINRANGILREISSNLIVLASIHAARGELEAALAEATEALDLDKRLENSSGIAQDLLALGLITARLGRPEESFRYLERAYGAYNALGHAPGMRSVLSHIVEAARAAGLDTLADGYERLRAEGGLP